MSATAQVPPTIAPPPLRLALGAREAAEACGVSLRSWRRLVATGQIPPGLRIGGRIVWPLDGPRGLRAWLDGGCMPADDGRAP